MQSEPIRFLDEEDMINLEKYEYHGGGYTYLDNFLNPFWTKVAYAFPTWFAPNLITLTGLMVNVVAALMVVFYDPYLVGNAPGWVYINAAICLQVYVVLDAADGKQARRLNASSPLGQIFDHGCDAINLIFIIITCCSGAGFGIGQMSALLVAILCSIFVCAQLIEYQSNVLLAGGKIFGVTEAMLFVSVLLLITGMKGIDFWDIDVTTYIPALKSYIPTLPVTHLFAVGLIVVVGSICCVYLTIYFFRESPIPMDKRGNKNLDRLSYLSRLVPVTSL